MPPGPVVLVGSDIPRISRAHIAEAFRLLGNADAVFGPAQDGGYWLVGFKRSPGRWRRSMACRGRPTKRSQPRARISRGEKSRSRPRSATWIRPMT
ncbi:DUF2064 domain-containing protein [Methyloceanibacter stevinii]|uniref:DUF2064 domain-containing protein n=1 Tax=Methyloceanibacter stevinii TaxID=1774970 RepID=UPI003CC7AD1D